MILGSTCTRQCAFCAVEHGRPGPVDRDEPSRLAAAAETLGARHIVITSVTRDDLPDEGAGQFAASVRAVRERLADATVEVLPPDLHARPECIAVICQAAPEVYNHNVETVERLTPQIRPQADYRRSLAVLATVKRLDPTRLTKSGLMLGMGEREDEVDRTLAELRSVGCDIVTIGQYLQPTPDHWPVARYWRPEAFESIGERARELGFAAVESGPFVRSSYNAARAAATAGAARSEERVE